MADRKISALTAASTPLAGTEVFPIVQGTPAATVKATILNVQEAPVSSGTADGVQYLNASKVPTTSSSLKFNGTIFGTPAINVTGNNTPANGMFLPTTNTLAFATNTAENGRVVSGFLKLANNGSYVASGSAYYELNSNQSGLTCYVYNSSATGDGYLINLNSSGTAQYFLRGYSASAGADKGYWYTDGSWQIAAGKTYGNLSDIKLKENIVDAKSKLADVMKLRVRNYSVKKEPGSKYIGWIAQEFEQVFPALVDETPDMEFVDVIETDENGNQVTNKVERPTGTSTKRIKESAMIPILTKALQELAQEFEAYKAAHP